MLEYYAAGATVLTVALLYVSRKYAGAIEKMRKTMREVAELLQELDRALEDNKITEEELRKIIKHAKELLK